MFFWLGNHQAYFSQFKESTESTNTVIRDECQLRINKQYNMKQFISLRITHFCMALKCQRFSDDEEAL